MMVETKEIFIPYSDFEDHHKVDFIRMDDKNTMVVSFEDKHYTLSWDAAYKYFAGEVAAVKGFVV